MGAGHWDPRILALVAAGGSPLGLCAGQELGMQGGQHSSMEIQRDEVQADNSRGFPAALQK